MTNPLRKQININQRVQVYRNLRKNLFSVLDKKSRRLILHQEALVLYEVEFRIQKAGQERVRRNKQKNVHAFVIGNYIGDKTDNALYDKLVYYNPYTTDTFVTENDNKPIYYANKCYLYNGMCFI